MTERTACLMTGHISVAGCLNVAILLIVFGMSAKPAAGDLPELDAVTVADIPLIEEEIIRQRRALTSGRVVWSVVDVDHVKGTSNSMQYTISFDNENFRSDLLWMKLGALQKEVFTESDGRIDVPSSTDRNVQVNPHYPNARQTNPVPDPRILGLTAYPVTNLNEHGYDSTGVLDPSRRNMKLSIIEDNGKRLLQIQYDWTSPAGLSLSCARLLSPDHGYLPVMCKTVFHIDHPEVSSPWIYTLHCDLRRYPEQGISYPSKVVFSRDCGSKGSWDQTVIVEDAQFGHVDAKEFTLAGLGLEKGRVIDFGGQLGTWNGDTFHSGLGWTGAAQTAADPARPARSRMLLTINAIVFAVIALVLLKYRSRRLRLNK